MVLQELTRKVKEMIAQNKSFFMVVKLPPFEMNE